MNTFKIISKFSVWRKAGAVSVSGPMAAKLYREGFLIRRRGARGVWEYKAAKIDQNSIKLSAEESNEFIEITEENPEVFSFGG